MKKGGIFVSVLIHSKQFQIMNQKLNSIKIFLLCPIPEEQKPISDYIQYRNALGDSFFNPFLFFRWKEIQKRLKEPTVFYEEGSWYDGQIWEKPFSVIKNDRLLSIQKVISSKRRIQTKKKDA
jgi:hypothetical protein